MSDPVADRELEDYLSVALAPVAADTRAAIDGGALAPGDVLAWADCERLADPAPLAGENGWATLEDGVGYVAVRTAMPGVSGEMVDWWFDWHPRSAMRYRVWHPLAHVGNRVQAPDAKRAKAHWGTVHHPVEDVGVGLAHARIAFFAPSEMGMDGDHLDDAAVATIVCGYAGDDRRHVRHTPMLHVFLRDGDGVVLRSRFWLGAALAPYGPLKPLGSLLLNRAAVRRRALPRRLPQALANHCAEEYARLGALLPELYERFAGRA